MLDFGQRPFEADTRGTRATEEILWRWKRCSRESSLQTRTILGFWKHPRSGSGIVAVNLGRVLRLFTIKGFVWISGR